MRLAQSRSRPPAGKHYALYWLWNWERV
jgi:hypothetical protein